VDWPYEIAERDHELQNPTSAEKIRLLGEYLRLGSKSRVLDIGCGKAGPAMVLASSFGCSITGVELRAGFADEARSRIGSSGLQSLIEVHTTDGASLSIEPQSWDASR
jgi:cyclopropane fatty-acyl-phospholipid synthase-like methyltransferase